MARPDLSYLKNLILVAVGIPCGVLTGVTGQSASPVFQPLVRWLLGLKGTILGGVVLGAVALSAWTGLFAYAQTRHVGWSLGVAYALGSLIGAAWGARLIKARAEIPAIARPIGALLTAGLALVISAEALGILPFHTLAPLPGRWLPPLGGFALGALLGFFGQAAEIGSVLTVPGLVYLLGRPILEAQGTALLVTVLAALPVALLYLSQRLMDLRIALALSFGGFLGALFGSRLAVGQFSDTGLLLLQGLMLIGIGLSLLFQKAPPADDAPRQE